MKQSVDQYIGYGLLISVISVLVKFNPYARLTQFSGPETSLPLFYYNVAQYCEMFLNSFKFPEIINACVKNQVDFGVVKWKNLPA